MGGEEKEGAMTLYKESGLWPGMTAFEKPELL
jgi:hypothetical protein